MPVVYCVYCTTHPHLNNVMGNGKKGRGRGRRRGRGMRRGGKRKGSRKGKFQAKEREILEYMSLS